MTADEFAVQVEALIEAGRAGGLSDEQMATAPENVAEALDEGMS
jgi:hypothetical protein